MVFWERKDLLFSQYRTLIDFESIAALRQEAHQKLDRAHWKGFREILEKLPTPITFPQIDCDFSSDVIRIGHAGDLAGDAQRELELAIAALIPWRKGPFELFGRLIDAEWRSNLKWDRIAPHLGSLEGKRVLDVGCGNGYYMFRASAQNPECIIGLDPSEMFFYAFEFMQRFARNPGLQFELLGIEHAPLFRGLFDTALCMGVLYHQRNPLKMLVALRAALCPGGLLLVEGQAIEGDESVALCPAGRYAKMRNVHFIPTAQCLKTWVERAGFEEVEIVSVSKTTPEEQRKTEFAPFESLSDFLDPDDANKTIEGYPAPMRVAVRARNRASG